MISSKSQILKLQAAKIISNFKVLLILTLFGLSLANFKLAASEALHVEQDKKHSILWVGQHLQPANDLVFKGFQHEVKNLFHITYISTQENSAIVEQTDINHYDYIIASGDLAWKLIEPLETGVPKLGIGVGIKSFPSYSSSFHTNEYLITKEQSPQRIFSLISALDLNHTQSSALFNKKQFKQKLNFINVAKANKVPFESIVYKTGQSIFDIAVSIDNCCRVLYFGQQDFNNNPLQHKSLLLESYRRKIITISNNKNMIALGAMYVIYTPGHELGKQGAYLIRNLMKGKAQKAYQYPDEFVINSNLKIKSIIGGTSLKQSIGEITQRIKLAEHLAKQDVAL